MKKLDDELFSSIVANTPLISIDLVIRSSGDEVLLGQRTNRPAQGKWFVPGGRILKDESMSDAFLRLTREELGLEHAIDQGIFLGVYEHFYPENYSGEGFSTHYVVLGYQLNLDIPLEALPKGQHGEYRWWKQDELLQSDEVHLHSQWYLDPSMGVKTDCSNQL